MKANATTQSASIPSDGEIRLGREAVIAVKQGWAEEIRVYTDNQGRVCTRKVGFSDPRFANG